MHMRWPFVRCEADRLRVVVHLLRSILAGVNNRGWILLVVAGTLTVGCVQRKLTVTSEPSGALVYLNNREAGRTPFTTDFTWYGDYDVVVRKDGFQTITTKKKIAAPWWQYPPVDLFAEITPGQKVDRHTLNFTLTPEQEIAASVLIARATELRKQLPTTQPIE